MRSLQKHRNDATILYHLIIFVVCPIYPCLILARNLAMALWRRYRRTHYRHHLRVHFWSNLIGLQVIAADESSESFSAYVGWRAEVHAMDNLPARAGRALVLTLTTVQSLGMFVRVLCRLVVYRGGWFDHAFQGIAVADFEAFHLSMGMMAILFMSWSAWALNVTWREDPETLPGPKRLHSERFWTSDDRALAKTFQWILVKGSMLGLLALTVFYAYVIYWQSRHPWPPESSEQEKAMGILPTYEGLEGRFYNGATILALWSHETSGSTSTLIYLVGCYCKIALSIVVPLILWLRAGDNEATPGRLGLAMQGFVASILWTAYRIYYQANTDTFKDEPVSLTVVLTLTMMRYLLLRCSRKGAWTRAARVSRVALLVLWVLLTIIAPAFVLTAMQLAPDSCADQAKKDPIWTPSF